MAKDPNERNNLTAQIEKARAEIATLQEHIRHLVLKRAKYDGQNASDSTPVPAK